MKLAWFLIILGGLLLADGTTRIALGIMSANYFLAVGGVVTGWLLGGLLISNGFRRKHKFTSEINDNS